MGFEDENNLGGCDDAERLWAKLKGWYQGWGYEEPEDMAADLILQGADAAEIIYRDVKSAVLVEYDNVGTVTNVSVEVSPLGGEDNVPRIQAVLREIGGQAARKATAFLCLIDGLDSTGRAERVLGNAGTAEALHVLSRRLSSPFPAVAKSAAAALRRHRAKSATEDLPKLLAALTVRGYEDYKPAIDAAMALGKDGNAAAVGPLLALFSRDTICWGEEKILAAAAWALGRIGDRRALDTLVATIGKYNKLVSEAAVEAVVLLGGDQRAVVPTLRVLGPVRISWEGLDAPAAVKMMGPSAFETLLAATEDNDDRLRSLALHALAYAAAGDDAAARRERAIARAVILLADPSARIRFSVIRLLHSLDASGRTELLLPLLEDDAHDNWFEGRDYSVREAAADALPDDAVTAERLRQALDGTPLTDGSRLRASSVWMALTSGGRGGRRVHWLDIVAPYVVREAEGESAHWEATKALADPQIMDVLKSVAPDKRSVAEEIARKDRERQEAQRIIRWRLRQPSPPRPPEQVRAAILVRFERLEEEVLEWLAWSDADLLALPSDLQQAWAKGPSAWKAALWLTPQWLPSSKHDPLDRPQQVHRAAPFRDAEYAYMKSHLSAEDHAWYLAGERVRAMRDQAQAAWEKGPLAWAVFLAPSRSKPTP